ncbi:iron-containing alcohol dehydrogenase [Escherichia coli]
MAHDEQWLTPRLQTAATLCNQTPAATESPLWLGVDLGTCDVVSMVVDRDGQPVAVCLDWADVVRDGIVWDFFGAVTIVRRHLDTLEQQFGRRFSHVATSFPPGTDPRISINVLESAGLEVSHVLDEPTAVADLLQLDMPTVMEFNRMVCRERFSQVGRALRTKKSDDRDAINAVSELIAEVGIGKRMGDVGATSAHYGAWAQAALEDICLRSNPRTASLEQIVGLYAAAQ